MEEEKKLPSSEETTPKPKRKRTQPKEAEPIGIAGNPAKYKEAHENKYAPKEKIGTPTLGRSPNFVTTVGLGNLKVITPNGTEYRP